METVKRFESDSFVISEEVIDWIITNLDEKSVILELGSGYGSCKLSKKYKIFSIEHNKDWLNICPDVEYIFAPIRDDWYDPIFFIEKIPKKYDLLILDGPPNKLRINFINYLEYFIDSKIILVDDTHRAEDKKILDFLLKNNFIVLSIIKSIKKESTILKKI